MVGDPGCFQGCTGYLPVGNRAGRPLPLQQERSTGGQRSHPARSSKTIGITLSTRNNPRNLSSAISAILRSYEGMNHP